MNFPGKNSREEFQEEKLHFSSVTEVCHLKYVIHREESMKVLGYPSLPQDSGNLLPKNGYLIHGIETGIS